MQETCGASTSPLWLALALERLPTRRCGGMLHAQGRSLASACVSSGGVPAWLSAGSGGAGGKPACARACFGRKEQLVFGVCARRISLICLGPASNAVSILTGVEASVRLHCTLPSAASQRHCSCSTALGTPHFPCRLAASDLWPIPRREPNVAPSAAYSALPLTHPLLPLRLVCQGALGSQALEPAWLAAQQHPCCCCRSAYQRALAVPSRELDALWRQYEQLELQNSSKVFARRVLDEQRPRYQASKAAQPARQRLLGALELDVFALPPGGV